MLQVILQGFVGNGSNSQTYQNPSLMVFLETNEFCQASLSCNCKSENFYPDLQENERLGKWRSNPSMVRHWADISRVRIRNPSIWHDGRFVVISVILEWQMRKELASQIQVCCLTTATVPLSGWHRAICAICKRYREFTKPPPPVMWENLSGKVWGQQDWAGCLPHISFLSSQQIVLPGGFREEMHEHQSLLLETDTTHNENSHYLAVSNFHLKLYFFKHALTEKKSYTSPFKFI